MPRLTVLSSPKLKNLAMDDRLSVLFCNLELIGREFAATLTKLDRDRDRALLAAAHQLPKASPPRDRCTDVLCERVLQEGKHVEKRGLAGSICSDNDAQSWQVTKLCEAKDAVVADFDRFNLHNSTHGDCGEELGLQ